MKPSFSIIAYNDQIRRNQEKQMTEPTKTKNMMNKMFEVMTPDEVAETMEGIYPVPGLYEALWACVKDYKKIDKEDIGPHDVIGINCLAKFWSQFSDEHKEALNKAAARRDEEIRKWREGR